MTPQTSLDDRYLLLRRLAFGGMGEVWEGSDVVLDRAVAVKILRAELADDDAFRRRFRAEARTAGRVPHPGIAAVYDYGETWVDGKDLAYLVMELVPGEALSSILARQGALGTDRTLDVVAQAARALHAAHERGVIHRDVKPANLMVTPDGRVKVTDFGIARPDDHEPLTATGQVMGTAHYLAPELARGRAATPASDIYALGVVAYECLAGRRPFEGDDQIAVATAHLSEPPPPLPETIDPDVRALVGAAMEKDPQRRIAGADVLAEAAEGLRHAGPGTDHGTGATAWLPGAAGFAATPLAPGSGPQPGVGYDDHGYPGYAGPGSGTVPGWATPYPGVPPVGAGTGGVQGTGSGALFTGGTPFAGSGGPGRPPTSALPLEGPGGSYPAGRRRSPSLPLLALVGLVLLVVVGAAVAALRPDGNAGAPAPKRPVPTPTTSTSHARTTAPATQSRTGSGSSSQPVRTAPPSTSRTSRTSSTTRGTPTPTTSTTTRTTTTSSSPSPRPTEPGTTTTKPSPSPSASASPAGRAAAVALPGGGTGDTVQSGPTTERRLGWIR